ncbi:site-specific DNA-methyltransferase [Aliarcobacter skirrowii]|uniref:site-specific DNA-methyltransferase n=1 Tax=Aliarcobacter skirrowii TaxID=28200 RepID=UPI0021B3CE26|nr:site-specific DNA-methyltransferase [Aliarcobacter skirrowii]MCT7446039.1 site-specific DNA-methyltransferase [Aliarcobacter skirrowii]
MLLSFKQHIENLFKNSQTFSDSNKVLFIPKILEAIEKIDIELVKILKNDDRAKKHFFTQIDDIYVLNQNKLIEFFTLNDYMKNGSYTSYTNKIGLIKKDNFIKKFDDVVLAFPHKDCVLEGGQAKDDDYKKEVFYNEILSSDEIDRLFEPKVLTNIKRYSKDGAEENCEIKNDDNLIIKGNNLIALHSLKKKYAEKVKLIYIDPPYNTGNDSFKYNDNFNHSTWLTFMKNRLEAAREFLRDDGVIFVQCDDNEQAYLKVLMDEIFHKENFLNSIAIRSSTPSGLKTAHRDKTIIKTKDYILVYSKYLKKINIKPQYIKKERWDTHYNSFFDKDNMVSKKLIDIMIQKKLLPENSKLTDLNINDKNHREFYIKYADCIYRTAPEMPKEQKNISLNNKNKIISYYDGDENLQYALNGNRFSFLSQTLKPVLVGCSIENDISNLLCDFWSDIDFQNTQNQGNVNFENAKKPEQLLYRIIDMVTNNNDIVMDFNLGSGTTCAVAHKMGRRYIGIEQMDYIEDIAVERLKKVIDGEQGGISKALNWKGGGDFVYAELKQIDTFKNVEIGALNKNMQYLPISEIEDETYNLKKEEIEINKKFYGIENE